MSYSPENRLKIVTAICDNYAELDENGRGASWEACIKAQGIDRATFYHWIKKFDELNNLYKNAEDARVKTERAEILRTSHSLLLRRLKNGTKIVKREGVPDGNGGVITTKITEETRECSDACAFFVLKSLDPAFAENKPAGNEAEAALAQAVDPSVLFKKALSKEDKEDATSEQTPQTA